MTFLNCANRRMVFLLLGLILLSPAWGGNGALEMRNGYFWDPLTGEYFLPRGIAYQTFNPPVGANQSVEQLRYDLTEFKKMHCNSVRCEMVWSQVEPEDGVYDWERPDALVRTAEELGLKLFVLIGFQYPPFWFPEEWRATDERGGRSEMLSYERPEARQIYERFIREVTGRYRNSTAIGGWILGNEYAYFDLWTADHLFVGYDPVSLSSFQRFLRNEYGGDITALNATWDRDYASFDEVAMPGAYPSDRRSGAHHDLIRWREHSIGEYVAVGAVAARAADPNHLISYSMIGGLFIGNDAIYTCEDARTIVAACAAAGAPLDFWSINNYAWASFVGEMRTGDFGIRKHAFDSGLPVMISETGHTATDAGLVGSGPRQGDAIVTQMWEAFMSGAVGTHLFTWQDREMYAGSPIFEREMTFGVVHQNRKPKVPGYANLVSMFRTMEALGMERLFGGSRGPDPRLWFLWSDAAKMGWPRANMENAMVWNTLKRLGYQPGILYDAEFERGDYADRADVLILCRALQMKPGFLDRIANDVLPRGIHLFANADLPGRYNAYHQPDPAWPERMREWFGLDVTQATAWDSGSHSTSYRPLELTVVAPLEPLGAGFRDTIRAWRIWQGITAAAGTTLATHRGPDQTSAPMPAVQLHSVGSARTAAATFSLADNWNSDDASPRAWDHRYRWLKAIFQSHFELTPPIELSGPGASYVIPEYRHVADGSLLISLLNGHTNRAEVSVSAPALLLGLTVEDLTRGGVLETGSDGVVQVALRGDEFVLLLAYVRDAEGDRSPVNASPNKVWFVNAPGALWPSARPAVLEVGCDTVEPLELLTVFERISFPPLRLASSDPASVSGTAARTFELTVPGADLGDIYYRSSLEGGEYRWRAVLRRGSVEVASVSLPVRLLWGVKPITELPRTVTGGERYAVALRWEELPAYEPEDQGLPLDRGAMWEQTLIGWQHYQVMIEMLDPAGNRLATGHHLTRSSSGTATMELAAPANYTGPVEWLAYLRPKPQASFDHFDSFETRGPGADRKWLEPWAPYVYSETGAAEYFDSGVGRDDWSAPQYGFVVVTNPPTAGAWSGFGLKWEWPYTVGLPEDLADWPKVLLSARFRETAGLACVLELQVNDAEGGQLQFTQPYEPGPDGWGEIRATLDQFSVTPYEPYNGGFNLARVSGIAVNVRMLELDRTYVGFFDDIHLDGPEDDRPPVTTRDVWESFEDRALGDDPGLTAPWSGYVYSGSGQSQFVAQGVHQVATHGLRSAFLVATNAPDPGGFAGMGFYFVFPEPWALGANPALQAGYRFGFAFREAAGHPCRIELQVKSGAQDWIEFSKNYQPGAGGWDTVEAALTEFRSRPGTGDFDPGHIEALAVNVRFLAPSTTYAGSFDQIRFDGPDALLEPDLDWGVYRSEDGAGIDADQDGILDRYETGHGSYQGPADTGTSPQLADSDGDGMPDGAELLAGTDPNDPADFLAFSRVERVSESRVRLTWPGRAGRRYTVDTTDVPSLPQGNFWPVPGLTGMLAVGDMPIMEGFFDAPPGEGARYFRLTVVGLE